ncbi:hypothetical protein Tco_0069609, partial [Tanacetum coccineum]
ELGGLQLTWVQEHSRRCEDLLQQIEAIRRTLSQSTGALE